MRKHLERRLANIEGKSSNQTEPADPKTARQKLADWMADTVRMGLDPAKELEQDERAFPRLLAKRIQHLRGGVKPVSPLDDLICKALNVV